MKCISCFEPLSSCCRTIKHETCIMYPLKSLKHSYDEHLLTCPTYIPPFYNFFMQSGRLPPTPDPCYTIWCILDDHKTPFSVQVPDKSNVDYLKQKIKEREPALRDIGVLGLILWQLEILVAVEPIDTLHARLPSTLNTSCVKLKNPAQKIQTLFPDGPSDNCIHILVVRQAGLLRAVQELAPSGASTSMTRSLLFDSVCGNNPHFNSQWSARETLVSALYTALNREYLIQVRGTPASGKTVLMHLLHQRIRQDYPQAFIRQYTSWPQIEGGEPGDRLRILDPLYPRDKPGRITFLLLDDAQDTYGDNRLWAGFLKSVYGKMSNYRVALFCNYENQYCYQDPKGTAPILREAACFSLWPKPDLPWGLLLRWDEFLDVVRRYDPMCEKMDESLLKCIYEWTAGHVGATCELLHLILRKQSPSLRNRPEKFTDEDFTRDFPLQSVLDELSRFGDVAYGLPGDVDYEPQVIDVFHELLVAGRIEYNPWSPNANVVHKCHRQGWLHKDYYQGRPCYFFPSPLHASCIAFRILPVDEIPRPPSVFDLSIEVIKQFKRSRLYNPIRRAVPVLPDHPSEVQWQDEYYRSAFLATGGIVRISPGFASARGVQVAGRIDFFVPSVKWGIEITRDGRYLRQYDERFQDSGAYHA